MRAEPAAPVVAPAEPEEPRALIAEAPPAARVPPPGAVPAAPLPPAAGPLPEVVVRAEPAAPVAPAEAVGRRAVIAEAARVPPSGAVPAAAPPAAPVVAPDAGEPNVAAGAEPALPVPDDAERVPANRGPSFDIVRISRRGHAVIAGRADPGAEVTVLAGDTPLGMALASQRGEWVLVPDAPLPAGPQQLRPRAVTQGGVVHNSTQVVTVVVPEAGAPPGARAVAVLQDLAGEEPPRVLAGAIADPGARIGDLMLDAVRYDEAGNVILSGRSRVDTVVRAFVDDIDVGFGAPSGEGEWEIVPDRALDVGRHELRLEQLDLQGALLARVELPFVRAELQGGLAPGIVVVQPGNSLWRIARAVYGKGTLYTVVFLHNADQIEDPHLIYPGQLFTLPALPAED